MKATDKPLKEVYRGGYLPKDLVKGWFYSSRLHLKSFLDDDLAFDYKEHLLFGGLIRWKAKKSLIN